MRYTPRIGFAETRCGDVVRIICVDNVGDNPIVGTTKSGGVCLWDAEGKHKGNNSLDLVKEWVKPTKYSCEAWLDKRAAVAPEPHALTLLHYLFGDAHIGWSKESPSNLDFYKPYRITIEELSDDYINTLNR